MEMREKTVNVALEGEYDVSNSGDLARLLSAGRGADEVVIDCANLDFIDSTALTQLFRLYQTVENTGGRVTLCNVRPHIRKIFALTRLDAVFSFRES